MPAMLNTVFLLLLAVFCETAICNAAPITRFIFSYQPRTDISDHLLIDLDQKELEFQLSTQTDLGFQNALSLYADGGHSKSFAYFQLTSPLSKSFPHGTNIHGLNMINQNQSGKLMTTAKEGTKTLEVQYSSSEECQVGGKRVPKLEGCFQAKGWLLLTDLESKDQVNVTYTYEPTINNRNAQTLQLFSEKARIFMWDCPNCPYADFKKFKDYYGRYNYADTWILSAFQPSTTFFSNGNADFNDYGKIGQSVAIEKASVYMSVWMYVIRQMELSLDICNDICSSSGCNDEQVGAWDQAVAFYTGSEEDGTEGYLLYRLADKQCSKFGTCGENGSFRSGSASINIRIFEHFILGQRNLLAGNCDKARQNKEQIVHLMTVPMIQGILHTAHVLGVQHDNRESNRAKGAAFAASILPIIYHCNPQDAKIIYDNMKFGSNTTNFVEVKEAMERNYGCLGIVCKDVGGLIDGSKNDGYLKFADPCETANTVGAFHTIGAANTTLVTETRTKPPVGSRSSREENAVGVVAFPIMIVVVLAFIVLMCFRSWKSTPVPEYGVDTHSAYSGHNIT